jgi:hypothetical protein
MTAFNKQVPFPAPSCMLSTLSTNNPNGQTGKQGTARLAQGPRLQGSKLAHNGRPKVHGRYLPPLQGILRSPRRGPKPLKNPRRRPLHRRSMISDLDSRNCPAPGSIAISLVRVEGSCDAARIYCVLVHSIELLGVRGVVSRPQGSLPLDQVAQGRCRARTKQTLCSRICLES